MKFKWLPRILIKDVSIALCFSILCVPIIPTLLLSQDMDTACADAEHQAQSDISGGTWFLIGCVIGPIGYLIALSEPYPPSTKLLGKSPEYVAAYTDCYRKKGKTIKSKNALTGCLVATGVSILIPFIVYVVISGPLDESF